MGTKKLRDGIILTVLPVLIAPASAYEISEQFSIGALLGSAIQCRDIHDESGKLNSCEAAMPVQLSLELRPTISDEVLVKFGFAAGKGLNRNAVFAISPWAADLEDDVRSINGRERDYLLSARYKHYFIVEDEHRFAVSLGIIDATDYLDDNAYANDEYTQFMNAALTNGPNVFLPSYDMGVALEWEHGDWSLRGVLMDVGENDDGNNFRFYGMQAGYRVNNRLGAGEYRVMLAAGSQDFLNPSATRLENRAGALLSFDQEIGKTAGGWIRFGWQTDKAAVDFNAIYSGGVDFRGELWGRGADNIGLGYAWLNGGSLNIEQSSVFETYYRWQLGEVLGLTADVQYLRDDYNAGEDQHGWIYSVRAVAEF